MQKILLKRQPLPLIGSSRPDRVHRCRSRMDEAQIRMDSHRVEICSPLLPLLLLL